MNITRRFNNQLVEINPEGELVSRRIYRTINQAKRLNRGNKAPNLTTKPWDMPKAEGFVDQGMQK